MCFSPNLSQVFNEAAGPAESNPILAPRLQMMGDMLSMDSGGPQAQQSQGGQAQPGQPQADATVSPTAAPTIRAAMGNLGQSNSSSPPVPLSNFFAPV